MRIRVSRQTLCPQAVERINAYLPKGVRITGCRLKSDLKKTGPATIHRYRVDLKSVKPEPEMIRRFEDSDQWFCRRTRGKGTERTLDLRAAVKKVEIRENRELYLEIDARKRPVVRPNDFLAGVLELTPEALQEIVVTKLAAA
jgi:hypothetical protein